MVYLLLNIVPFSLTDRIVPIGPPTVRRLGLGEGYGEGYLFIVSTCRKVR